MVEACEVPMANASAWFALVGVLGGVTVTGVMGLATATLNHRWEEQRRISTHREQEGRVIRDQRREACHDYLLATNAFWQAMDQLNLNASRGRQVDRAEYLRETNTTLQDTYVYLTISCGAKVRELADSYQGKLYELAGESQDVTRDEWGDLSQRTHQPRKELREAMRNELNVGD
jgi:hypothetical protein